MSRYFFYFPRQFGRKRALDLVAQEISDLQERSQKPVERSELYDALQAAAWAWCAPHEDDYNLVCLPDTRVTRG